ncbi:hypothetical protein LCGC14_2097110, partial [marine sediment metagenome]
VDELVEGFDLGAFGSAPTKFDPEDLRPLTARTLAARPFAQVRAHILAIGVPEALAERFWTVTRENISTLSELESWWAVFRDGAEPVIAEEDAGFVTEALGLLGTPPYDDDSWKAWTDAVKAQTGRKGRGLFMPLRQAVTGRDRGPEMADVMPLLQVKPSI